jgi:NAD(P)-dependent dehydrogenase (short-subunit alcohol dehydrogenase family)
MTTKSSSSDFNREPIDCTVTGPKHDLTGKVALVTGGSNGIGAEYVKRLVQAGARVCVGDVDETGARALQDKFGADQVSFSKCSVTRWEDQVTLFKEARKHTGSVDIVIANAGIAAEDELNISAQELDSEVPPKPELRTLNINLIGVFYTTKLALHQFQRQHQTDPKAESVLILQGSLAGYLSLPNVPQYNASKYGLRGMLRALVLSSPSYGTRVNYIAPWFISTSILSPRMQGMLANTPDGFATIEDAGSAMIRVVNFEEKNHGRTLAVVPRVHSKTTGYLDLDQDDFDPKESFLGVMQERLLGLKPPSNL